MTNRPVGPLARPAAVAAPLRTSWAAVAALMGGGVVAAAQIGGASAALPVLQAEFGLSSSTAAWYLSMVSALGAAAGVLIGWLGQTLGVVRQVRLGLGAIVLADLAGALVDSLPGLLAARVGEGVGLVLVVLATPGLLGKVTAPGHRRLVVGAWGAYMPVGSGLAALLVPLAITAWSWRGASVADAVVAACVLLAAWRWVPSAPERPAVSLDRLRWVFRSRTVLVLTAVFTAYSGQYLAVVGLLPAALVADDGFSLAVAGSISALVFLANAPGNFVGAYLLHRGVSPRSLMAAGSVGMGVSVWGVLDAGLPLALRIGAAVAFSATAGLVPSAAFSAVVTASAEADTAGPAVGLMTQGSSLGQLLGPPLVVAVGAAFGSGAARPATLGCLALLALLSACALPRRQPIS